MDIGLYFGSFNPVHIGHLIIGNHVLNETLLQKIWFVVSPQNPFKTEATLLSGNKRLALVNKAISGDKRFQASNVEFKLSKPSFTINTLDYLGEKYPKHRFSIIMGSDNFLNLNKWKDAKKIANNYKIFVYPRPGTKIQNTLKAKIKILKAPLLDISSSEIRGMVKEGKSIRYLVPEPVRKEIERHRYYKK